MIIQLVITLLVLGLLLWAMNQLPIDATIKGLIRVVIIVVGCLYLIYAITPLLERAFPGLR